MRLSFPHPLYWYEVGMLIVSAVQKTEDQGLVQVVTPSTGIFVRSSQIAFTQTRTVASLQPSNPISCGKNRPGASMLTRGCNNLTLSRTASYRRLVPLCFFLFLRYTKIFSKIWVACFQLLFVSTSYVSKLKIPSFRSVRTVC